MTAPFDLTQTDKLLSTYSSSTPPPRSPGRTGRDPRLHSVVPAGPKRTSRAVFAAIIVKAVRYSEAEIT